MHYWDRLDVFERLRNDALAGRRSVSAAMLRTRQPTQPVMRIYFGPPGTGKTVAAIREAVSLADPGWVPTGSTEQERLAETFEHFWALEGQVEFVTFSAGDQYETVVEAIRPRLTGSTENDEDKGQEDTGDSGTSGGADEGADEDGETGAPSVDYHYWEGPVLRIIRHALSTQDPHVLVIDEINRADISQVLGPLIAAIEADKRVGAPFPVPFQLRYGERGVNEFMPANLHILGTMNSADRNLALVDFALRRRFEFVRMNAKPSDLSVTTDGVDPIDLSRLLLSLNARLAQLLGADFEIGHSYLLRARTNEEVVRVFATQVLPLLEEYFYGDDEGLLLVLGELPEAAPPDRIYNVTLPSAGNLEPIFASASAARVAAQHVAGVTGKSVFRRRLRKEFWDAEGQPPKSGDLGSASKALIKIYAPPTQPAPAALPANPTI